MKKRTLFFLFIIILQSVNAQQLIEKSKTILQLKNGLELHCYKAFSFNSTEIDNYYFTPVNIHFAITDSGEKAHSLMVYKDANNQIKGGIMHWILSWGIDQNSINEARIQLKSRRGNKAYLVGSVMPEKSDIMTDFEILGSSQLAKLLQTSVVSQGKVPLISNAKIAVAFRFSKDGASKIKELMSTYSEQKTTYVIMRFTLILKKTNGRLYKKQIQIKKNLQNLLYQ
jgi:hypothetical protein